MTKQTPATFSTTIPPVTRKETRPRYCIISYIPSRACRSNWFTAHTPTLERYLIRSHSWPGCAHTRFVQGKIGKYCAYGSAKPQESRTCARVTPTCTTTTTSHPVASRRTLRQLHSHNACEPTCTVLRQLLTGSH